MEVASWPLPTRADRALMRMALRRSGEGTGGAKTVVLSIRGWVRGWRKLLITTQAPECR